MGRKSLEERRAALAGRRDELEHAAGVLPTEVHTQTVEVLTHLLEMGKAFSSDDIPTPLRVLMRTVDKMKPTLTAELASVPPAQIQDFMRMIRDEIDKIVEADPAPQEEQSA